MNAKPFYYSTKGAVLRGYIVSFLIMSFALLFSMAPLEAAAPWSIEIDAASPSFLSDHSFGKPVPGYTDTVPPSSILQRLSFSQDEEGYRFKLHGIELSAWQTAEVPSSSRYLLDWHFEYEGQIVEGDGRTGFIFGNPETSNLLSVEITYFGSLRLVSWGKALDDNLGRIVWSKQATNGGRGVVRITADYSIREDTLTCSVNGGEPIVIELRRYMPSAPMTIRGVGFFSAVHEARRISKFRPRNLNFDIDMSRRYVDARHKRLLVEGTN